MKIILTGLTGSLGHEIALNLNRKGHSVIPIVRSIKNQIYTYPEVIQNDLTKDEKLNYKGIADCIIHSAGNIHFLKSGDTNQKMMTKLVQFAKKMQLPLYFISTAYIYPPPGQKKVFNNAYELDKFKAEQILISSGIKYGIFRPSVLVGNSKSGEIKNFSGYYTIVKAFFNAITAAKKKNRMLRFPTIPGKSNLVPVDLAAEFITDQVQKQNKTPIYVVNKNPPEAFFVLDETIKFFNLTKYFNVLNLNFDQFAKLDLTEEEETLYKFIKIYYPYWSITYDFPTEMGLDNAITHEYLKKTLTFLKATDYLKS